MRNRVPPLVIALAALTAAVDAKAAKPCWKIELAGQTAQELVYVGSTVTWSSERTGCVGTKERQRVTWRVLPGPKTERLPVAYDVARMLPRTRVLLGVRDGVLFRYDLAAKKETRVGEYPCMAQAGYPRAIESLGDGLGCRGDLNGQDTSFVFDVAGRGIVAVGTGRAKAVFPGRGVAWVLAERDAERRDLVLISVPERGPPVTRELPGVAALDRPIARVGDDLFLVEGELLRHVRLVRLDPATLTIRAATPLREEGKIIGVTERFAWLVHGPPGGGRCSLTQLSTKDMTKLGTWPLPFEACHPQGSATRDERFVLAYGFRAHEKTQVLDVQRGEFMAVGFDVDGVLCAGPRCALVATEGDASRGKHMVSFFSPGHAPSAPATLAAPRSSDTRADFLPGGVMIHPGSSSAGTLAPFVWFPERGAPRTLTLP